MKKTSIFALLVIIILIGTALRFYKIGEKSFDRDEFFELNSSYGYFKTGSFMAWDFNNEAPFSAELQDDSSNERAEVFRWQLAQVYRFADPTEANTRAIGALWGVIGIILVYFITLSFTKNKYIALIAAFLAAAGESEIIYSRRLRMYSMFFPAYLFFTWMVYKFYESRYKGKFAIFRRVYNKTGFNPAYLLPAVVVGLISYNVHILTVNIAITILIYAAIRFLWKFKDKPLINKYSITLLAFILGFSAAQLPIFYGYYKSLKKNIQLFRSNYDFFAQYFSDWIYPAIGAIFVIIGIWFLAIRMEKKKEALFLTLSAVAPMLMAVFAWKREQSHRYIYFLQSFGIILSAAGIYGVIQLVASRIKNYNCKKIAVIILLIAFLSGVNYGYLSKKSDVYVQKSNSYYPDFETIFGYVKQHKSAEDVMITRAYRSFYWRGAGIKTYDIKSLQMGATGCQDKIDKIVKENPSGWVVYPKVDKLNVCSAGRDYYKNNLARIKDNQIPSSVEVYRWGNGS